MFHDYSAKFAKGGIVRTEYVKRLEKQAAPGYDVPVVATQTASDSFEITAAGDQHVVNAERLDELAKVRNVDPRLPEIIVVDLRDD